MRGSSKNEVQITYKPMNCPTLTNATGYLLSKREAGPRYRCLNAARSTLMSLLLSLLLLLSLFSESFPRVGSRKHFLQLFLVLASRHVRNEEELHTLFIFFGAPISLSFLDFFMVCGQNGHQRRRYESTQPRTGFFYTPPSPPLPKSLSILSA